MAAPARPRRPTARPVRCGSTPAADATRTPDLGPRSCLAGRVQQMVGLAGAVALLFLLLAVAQALLRGDPSLIISTLLVRLPLAFCATAALLFLTTTAVAAVDQ